MRESRADFGKELAKLRAEKGVSLEDMASAIKVRTGLVKALEDGVFEALPPAIFVEGYLKAYAGQLGVEPAPILARYRALVPAPAPPPKAQPAVPALQEEGRSPGWLKWILLVAVLAAAGYGAYTLKGRMEPAGGEDVPTRAAKQDVGVQQLPAQAPAEASTPAEPSLQPAPAEGAAAEPAQPPPEPSPSATTAAPVAEPPSQQAPVPQVATEPNAALQTQEPAPSGDLVLTASAPCWCELWADGRRVLYRMVTAGERLGFRGTSFKASVGNAGAVDLVYRGRQVPLPREQGVVVKDLSIPAGPGGVAP